jgi:hypothetical protein
MNIAVLALLITTPQGNALNDRTGWFPFVIPSIETNTPTSPIDLSFLSPNPAGSNGFLRAKGEKLLDGNENEVRLFGTNICDLHVCPPKSLAPKIAKRLKQLGVNFIRLHYYDYAPSPDGVMNPDMQTLNPTKLDQMDWLIYHLKQNGIYLNLNLHVARKYPNQPAIANEMGKVVDHIIPGLIASQKQFATEILTHLNPYTALENRNEPAIAIIEVNNENALTMDAGGVNWTSLGQLPAADTEPLRQRWIAWLKQKYVSLSALQKAWNPSTTKTGKNLLSGQWEKETSGGSTSNLSVSQGVVTWQPLTVGSVDWSHQLHQLNVPVKDQASYIFNFEARSSDIPSLNVRFMHSQSPWGEVSPQLSASLNNNWKPFRLAFQLSNNANIPIRLSFSTSNRLGTVQIRNATLVAGKAGTAVTAFDTIPLGNGTFGPDAMRDFWNFVVDEDSRYAADMKATIRAIGARQIVVNTQINYGGGGGILRSQRHDDLTDIHEYPLHPDLIDRNPAAMIWATRNASVLEEAFGTFESLAFNRIAGKPFTVSEWDVNPPNPHASESYPIVTLLACLQGWSGLNEYSWLNFQPGNENPIRISSAFSTTGHTGQVAFIPTSALMFRLGLVEKVSGNATLNITEQTLRSAGNGGSAARTIAGSLGITPAMAYTHRMSMKVLSGDARDSVSMTAPTEAPTTEFKDVPSGKVMIHKSPKALMFMGRTGGQSVSFAGITLNVNSATMRNYGNFVMVSMDNLPLSLSRKILLSAVARTENQGMVYNPGMTSVGSNWGDGPVMCEPLDFRLSLPNSGWRATPISADGAALTSVNFAQFNSNNASKSVWYLFER